eukprot:3030207-Rhodomonas_salina.1
MALLATLGPAKYPPTHSQCYVSPSPELRSIADSHAHAVLRRLAARRGDGSHSACAGSRAKDTDGEDQGRKEQTAGARADMACAATPGRSVEMTTVTNQME